MLLHVGKFVEKLLIPIIVGNVEDVDDNDDIMVAPFNTTMPLNVTALEKVTIPLKND
jgi:hypothetical protein